MKFDFAIQSLVMAQVLLSLLSVSKNASCRFTARAFSTPSRRLAYVARPLSSRTSISPVQRRFFTAQVEEEEQTKLQATVEDDLDTALDDLFSDAFPEAPVKATKKVASSFLDDMNTEPTVKVRLIVWSPYHRHQEILQS